MIQRLRRLSFEAKLNLGIIAIIAAMALALLPFVASITKEALLDEHRKRGLELAASLAARAVDPLLALDFLRLRELVAETRQVAYVFIQDRAGRVVVHSFGPDFPVDLAAANRASPQTPLRVQAIDNGIERFDDIAALVRVHDEPVGTVRLGLSRTAVTQTLDRILSTLVVIFLTGLTLASAAGTLFARTITARLAHLQGWAESLCRRHPPAGASQSLAASPTGDEIDALERAFATMADELDTRMGELIQAQKLESLGKLAGGVAHEINTPLGVILGITQLLLDDVPADSSLAEDLRTIERHTKACRKIVADLLEFSRAPASEKVEMCFNNSVMEAVTLVRHTFSLDQVTIATDLDDSFPIIYGDPEELKQVWVNLLTNARDALPEGGGLIVVRTTLLRDAGCVRLQVADTGIGIDPTSIGKIFDPFFTTKPVGQGTGLGLSVSYSIIEKHKGQIQAHSPVPDDFPWPMPVDPARRGPGTLVTVTIPLDHASLEDSHGPHPRPR